MRTAGGLAVALLLLANAAGLRLGQLYSEAAVAAAIQGVRQLLIENGFPAPIVEVQTSRHAESQQVDVDFLIHASERAGIGEVLLTGDGELELFEVRRAAKWKDGKPFTEPRIRDGLARLERDEARRRLETPDDEDVVRAIAAELDVEDLLQEVRS